MWYPQLFKKKKKSNQKGFCRKVQRQLSMRSIKDSHMFILPRVISFLPLATKLTKLKFWNKPIVWETSPYFCTFHNHDAVRVYLAIAQRDLHADTNTTTVQHVP